jgi:hypothetical protein
VDRPQISVQYGGQATDDSTVRWTGHRYQYNTVDRPQMTVQYGGQATDTVQYGGQATDTVQYGGQATDTVQYGGQATDDSTIRRMRIACCITKAINTHS